MRTAQSRLVACGGHFSAIKAVVIPLLLWAALLTGQTGVTVAAESPRLSEDAKELKSLGLETKDLDHVRNVLTSLGLEDQSAAFTWHGNTRFYRFSAIKGERNLGRTQTRVSIDLYGSDDKAREGFEWAKRLNTKWQEFDVGASDKAIVRVSVLAQELANDGGYPVGGIQGHGRRGKVCITVEQQRWSGKLFRTREVEAAKAEKMKLAQDAQADVQQLLKHLVALGDATASDDSLRAAVRRLLKGGVMIAAADSDVAVPAEQIGKDLKTVVDASRKDPVEGPRVWLLVTGRLDAFAQRVGDTVGNWAWSDRRILNNLLAKLPGDHFLIRYFRARDREEQKKFEEFMAGAERGRNVLIVLVDIGSGLAGFPTPSAVLSQMDLYPKISKPHPRTVALGGLLTEDTGTHLANLVTNMEPVHISLSAGWTTCSFWAEEVAKAAGDRMPEISQEIQKRLDNARKQSEHAWFTQMNDEYTTLSYEVRRRSVVLTEIERRLKARGGWTRQKTEGMPGELLPLAQFGNKTEAWLKTALGQVFVTGYYSGYEPKDKAITTGTR